MENDNYQGFYNFWTPITWTLFIGLIVGVLLGHFLW